MLLGTPDETHLLSRWPKQLSQRSTDARLLSRTRGAVEEHMREVA